MAVGGAGVVERVGHRDALERPLLDAVDDQRRGEAGGLEHRRRHVDHVVELERISPLALMPAGQWTIVPFRVPPQCEATCFVHWYGVSIA